MKRSVLYQRTRLSSPVNGLPFIFNLSAKTPPHPTSQHSQHIRDCSGSISSLCNNKSQKRITAFFLLGIIVLLSFACLFVSSDMDFSQAEAAFSKNSFVEDNLVPLANPNAQGNGHLASVNIPIQATVNGEKPDDKTFTFNVTHTGYGPYSTSLDDISEYDPTGLTETIYWGIDSSWTLHLSSTDTISDKTYGSGEFSGDTVFETSRQVPWYSDKHDKIVNVSIDNTITPKSTAFWFYDFTNPSLTAIDVSNIDVSKTITMEDMFFSCSAVTTITGIDKWQTDELRNMSGVFSQMDSLAKLDLSGWKTSKVFDMDSLFYRCQALTGLGDISHWDVTSVEDMHDMFYDCSKLEQIESKVHLWSPISVKDFSYMFAGCDALISPDLTNWVSLSDGTTGTVTNLSFMFKDCPNLSTVNLSGMNTSSVKDMSGMFDGDSAFCYRFACNV